MAREMKNSGVQWVGEIPSSWEVIRMGYALCLRSDGKGMSDRKIGLENVESWTGKYIPTETDFEGIGNTFKKNDILFGKLRPYLAKVYLAEFEGQAVGDFLVFRAKHNVLPKFAKYYLLNPQIIDIINGFTYGSKMPRANWKDISMLPILLPSYIEQTAIADFLDAKCGEIDRLLADLDAEVKTLGEYKKSIIAETVTRGLNPNAPMKASGISWVGDIPSHWTLQPVFKYFHDRIFFNLDYEYKRAFKFNYGTLKYKEETGDLALYQQTYIKYSKVKKGDIVINGLNLNYDFISQRVAITPEDGIITSAYLTIRPFEGVCSEYYCYLFKAMDNMKLFHGMGKGVRLTLSFDELKRIKLPIPTEIEQLEIVKYLDEKCAAIEQSIADKQTQIETLKAYKSSLIYEYVTGKKQVV